MKICKKMFHELNFEPNAISPCCNTHALAIPKFPYAGGEVELEKYARHIENTLAEIGKGGKTCQNCPELVEIANVRDVSEGRFSAISVNMHRHFCNCQCVYCGLWQKRENEPPYDILPALASLKKQGAIAKDCVISWGGGEPTILSSFVEASAWGIDNGFIQIVHTNGIRFSESVERLLREGKGLINISLDSGSPEVYKRVKGVDCFPKVIENLGRYSMACASLIQLKYIVFEQNNDLAEIRKFLQLAIGLNIEIIEYSLNFVEINKGIVSEKTLLAAAFLEKMGKALGFATINKFYVDPKWQRKIDERISKI